MKYDALGSSAKALYDQNYKTFYHDHIFGSSPSIMFVEFMCTLAANNIEINFVPRGTGICSIGRAIEDAGGNPNAVFESVFKCIEWSNIRISKLYDLEAVYLG